MSEDVKKFEEFLGYVYHFNETLFEKLKERSGRIKFQRSEEDGILLSYVLEPNHTGVHLLNVLVAMVTHEDFNIRNSQRRGNQWQTKEHYLRTEIRYSESDKLTFHCHASKDQPGNALENTLASNDSYHDWPPFHDFLTMKQKEFRDTHKLEEWKLSVLLMFDIARRIPDGDIHRHIPVAATILMAMESVGENASDSTSIQELLCISDDESHKRNKVFRKFALKWFKPERYSEIRERFDVMMTILVEDPSNDEDNDNSNEGEDEDDDDDDDNDDDRGDDYDPGKGGPGKDDDSHGNVYDPIEVSGGTSESEPKKDSNSGERSPVKEMANPTFPDPLKLKKESNVKPASDEKAAMGAGKMSTKSQGESNKEFTAPAKREPEDKRENVKKDPRDAEYTDDSTDINRSDVSGVRRSERKEDSNPDQRGLSEKMAKLTVQEKMSDDELNDFLGFVYNWREKFLKKPTENSKEVEPKCLAQFHEIRDKDEGVDMLKVLAAKENEEERQDDWPLAVALVFYMARKKNGIHHHIPVAPTILMAMRASDPQDAVADLSKFFKAEQSLVRNEIFRKFARRWFGKVRPDINVVYKEKGTKEDPALELRREFENMMSILWVVDDGQPSGDSKEKKTKEESNVKVKDDEKNLSEKEKKLNLKDSSANVEKETDKGASEPPTGAGKKQQSAQSSAEREGAKGKVKEENL